MTIKKIETLIFEVEKQSRAARNLGRQEKTSWAVYDISIGTYLAEIRTSQLHQSACMSKPVVALAVYWARHNQKKKISQEEIDLMRGMIIDSENSYESELVQRIGGLKTVSKMFGNYPDIFGKTKFTELPKEEGNHYQNKACAKDYVNILKAMMAGQLYGSDNVLDLMRQVNYKALVSDVSGIPDNIITHNKTGSNGYVCGDMAIIRRKDEQGKERPYIIVGLITRTKPVHEDSAWWCWWQSRCQTLGAISGAVYREMSTKQGEHYNGR